MNRQPPHFAPDRTASAVINQRAVRLEPCPGILRAPLALLCLLLAGIAAPAQVSWLFASGTTSGGGGLVIIVSNNGWVAQGGGNAGGTTTPSAPAPVTCNYTLGAASANLGGGPVGDTFPVSAPAGCAWSAQSGAAWIHVSSSGSGDGWVSYVVDPNASGGLRTGTLTVGGQVFTVNQGPEGFVWHDVFGWLFNAGSSWHHASGLGWIWFDTGGQWIWSASLQGWLSITDYRARTAWTTQYGAVTFTASDSTRLETTALGPVYLGEYRGRVIPDGWVVSERYGYVWPAGDGVWFWSQGLNTWLGATPSGALWSAAAGRFL